jgi:stearoyl-CoA desaturase (delta-9 desaturase)
MVISGMRRVGLAWDVVTITPERQAQKLAGAQKPAPAKAPEEEKVAEPVA